MVMGLLQARAVMGDVSSTCLKRLAFYFSLSMCPRTPRVEFFFGFYCSDRCCCLDMSAGGDNFEKKQ
jgi:hypothetical protein